jgi:hypothetical protein
MRSRGSISSMAGIVTGWGVEFRVSAASSSIWRFEKNKKESFDHYPILLNDDRRKEAKTKQKKYRVYICTNHNHKQSKTVVLPIVVRKN